MSKTPKISASFPSPPLRIEIGDDIVVDVRVRSHDRAIIVALAVPNPASVRIKPLAGAPLIAAMAEDLAECQKTKKPTISNPS